MIQLALYQYYGELFFIRKQKNIVNQALIRRYQICYTLQKTTHYRPLCGEPHKICGEEAKLEGKPLNRALRDGDGDIYDIVAGKFFICGLGDENFASLPKELQQKYEEKFRQPEAFLKMGSKIMAIPTEPAKAAGKGKTAPVTER